MDQPEKVIAIRDLYSNLGEEELEEAERNFKAYIELAYNIFSRIASDPAAYEKLIQQLGENKKER